MLVVHRVDLLRFGVCAFTGTRDGWRIDMEGIDGESPFLTSRSPALRNGKQEMFVGLSSGYPCAALLRRYKDKMGCTARHHRVKVSCELFSDMVFGTRDIFISRCPCRLPSVPVDGPTLEGAFGASLVAMLLAVRPGSADILNKDHKNSCPMSRVVIALGRTLLKMKASGGPRLRLSRGTRVPSVPNGCSPNRTVETEEV